MNIKATLLAMALSTLVVGCSSPTDESSSAETAVETAVATPVTANELFTAYESNEVAADKQYKGQLLEVSGKVVSINSGLGDSANVSLETSNQFSSVTASGDDAFNEAAAGLNKGQDVVVVCKGGGEVIGSPVLKDCVIQ